MHSDTVQLGTLCAMIYVFDDNEEMQACCGCPVTPDGLRTMSVITNLTLNFAINKGDVAAGAIKMVSAEPNWYNPIPSAPPPLGIGAIGTTLGCDPSGVTPSSPACAGGRPIGGAYGTTPSPHGTNGLTPTQELRAWLNHTETMYTPPSSFTTSTSVEEFAKADLDSTELCNLEVSCGTVGTGASGVGLCTCGSGDSSSSFRPKP